MLSLLLFSGFITLTWSVSRQYVFVNEPKTWADAQRYCRDKYTDLVTIENEQQTFQLMDTVNSIDSINLAWIGLYDDLNSWNWTLEDSDFFKEGEKDYRNWYIQEPDNLAERLCVFMYSGIWYTIRCSGTSFYALCYDGKENASSIYVFINQRKTWDEAQSYCREHHTDLVSIRNESEHQTIQLLLPNYDGVWIGLYKNRSWSDQSNSSFSYWSSWQPDAVGFCTIVLFNDSGKWADENCNHAYPFFCHSELASSRQYHFVSESKIWTEAQRFCRQNYTDLATIDNMEDMNRLIDTVNGSYNGLAWIGQYDDVNSWRWSLEDNNFYQEGERDFRKWHQELNNNGGKEMCGYMNYDGKWNDLSCDNILPFICYNGRENATQSYIRINDGKNWTEARRYCRDKYTDLVNVRNQTENQKIFETLGGGVWIGLYRNRIWSNGQITSYENWRPQIPSLQAEPDNGINNNIERGYQHCTAVSFRHLGRWTDELCISSIPFFCYSRTCTQSSCTRQYHFLNESKTWTEAQRFCRQNYADLATIDNMEEMNRLFKTVRRIYYGKAWIGLYDDLNSWRWSLDNAELEGYESWFVQQPINSGGQSLCVYMSYNLGIWSEDYCLQTRSFVCYDGRVNASASYVFVGQVKNWTEAQSYCREHHTDLVSIKNEIENYRVKSLIGYYNAVWIGLYRSRSWSDQSNSSFSNWRSGQPDNAGNSQYCTAVSITDSGKWTDENCNTELPLICYSTLASSRQYHFVNESKSWTEAQRFCRQNYTDLATIDNMEEMNRLIDTVNGSFNGSVWIGQYDDVNSWRWSLEDNDFYQEGERDFRNFNHQPDNYAGKELCVIMIYDGNWYDSSCDNSLRFVCYDGRENATQRYVMVLEYRTWAGAQNYCREKYTDLASVRNETEHQQILDVIHNYCNDNYCYGYIIWIGLHRNKVWSDLSSSFFTYWLPQTDSVDAQPDNGLRVPGEYGAQHCTAVSLKYYAQWTDERCFASLPFFCYSIKLKSREDLSEFQIEEFVIVQLQQELIKLGVPSKFTMLLRDYRKIKP